MSATRDLDRRKPAPSNLVFEATDAFDPTATHFLMAYRTDDGGVSIAFVNEATRVIRDSMWIDGGQCEQFGNALLEAARIAREAEAKRT